MGGGRGRRNEGGGKVSEMGRSQEDVVFNLAVECNVQRL